MKYFTPMPETLEALKKMYKKLSFTHHPDCGGDNESMKIVNAEYTELFEKLKDIHTNASGEKYTKATNETPQQFIDIIDILIRFEGIVIEIIGSFVWVSANTKPYKDKLKEAALNIKDPIDFDKNPDNKDKYKDIVVELDPGDHEFKGIEYAGTPLKEGEDYTVVKKEDGKLIITIKKEFLAAKLIKDVENELIFIMSGGGNLKLKVKVTDSRNGNNNNNTNTNTGGNNRGGTTGVDPLNPGNKVEDVDIESPENGTPGGAADTVYAPFINGFPDGTVQPDGELTRAQYAQILYNLYSDGSKGGVAAYTDIGSLHWAYEAIAFCQDTGFMIGYPDGSFGPEKLLTRAELCTAVTRIKKLALSPNHPFSDVDGHWAVEYIGGMYTEKFISGYPDGTFKPDNMITRAEAVTITCKSEGRNQSLFDTDKTFSDLSMDHWAYEYMMNAANGYNYKN
jgi:hypothetical protein